MPSRPLHISTRVNMELQSMPYRIMVKHRLVTTGSTAAADMQALMAAQVEVRAALGVSVAMPPTQLHIDGLEVRVRSRPAAECQCANWQAALASS